MLHIYLWKLLKNLGFLSFLFQTSKRAMLSRQVKGRPRGLSQAPDRRCLRPPGTLGLNLPAWSCLPRGAPYFFFYYIGTGGQESESQGLGTSAVKRTSQGKTHSGLDQDGVSTVLMQTLSLPSLHPRCLARRTLTSGL